MQLGGIEVATSEVVHLADEKFAGVANNGKSGRVKNDNERFFYASSSPSSSESRHDIKCVYSIIAYVCDFSVCS